MVSSTVMFPELAKTQYGPLIFTEMNDQMSYKW